MSVMTTPNNKIRIRTAVAFLLVIAATFLTPVQAFCDAVPSLGVASLLVGLLFAGVALWGRIGILWRGDNNTKETLTAANRAKRILWIWAGFGGAVLVLSLSTSEASALDEVFGMTGFGWLIAGIAALLLESVAFSLEDALPKDPPALDR